MTKATPTPTIIQLRPLYLDRPSAAQYLSLSVPLLDLLVARGEIPRPKLVSKGRVAWLLADLDAYGLSRPDSDLLPPKNSGYGRAGKPKAPAAPAAESAAS